MLTDKERNEIYQVGYREGFAEALRAFDKVLKWMKQRDRGTSTVTTTLSDKDIWMKLLKDIEK